MNCLRLLALCACLALNPLARAAADLPDPARFGTRMEVGDLGQAKQWLDAGLDPNFVADRIGTGLMIGAWTGNVALMELFAARGADIHRTNRVGETALLHAAWKGHDEAVKWLLARGAKVNRDGLEWSALHYAAFAGHGDVAQLLLDRGADINAKSPNGSSVLMMAVYEGQDDIARMLVQRGADRRVRNERGDTALDWAIKFNRSDIAKLVATSEEIAVAASQPKNAMAQRSTSEPDGIEELLRIRRILEMRGLTLNVIDQRTAAMRARIALAALARERQKRMPVLEISARRGAPEEQRMELLWR